MTGGKGKFYVAEVAGGVWFPQRFFGFLACSGEWGGKFYRGGHAGNDRLTFLGLAQSMALLGMGVIGFLAAIRAWRELNGYGQWGGRGRGDNPGAKGLEAPLLFFPIWKPHCQSGIGVDQGGGPSIGFRRVQLSPKF
ncbi:MAG: hypothetical protein CM15mP46_4650 [Alphaproteobacteria bacterium]|nr:MAG: hypothetical protein CM15mP46_4650 [Alphaproteobacteria bacterium]